MHAVINNIDAITFSNAPCLRYVIDIVYMLTKEDYYNYFDNFDDNIIVAYQYHIADCHRNLNIDNYYYC